jgi:hypothetical protein
VAMIGCALPALRSHFADSLNRLSTALSSFTGSNIGHSTGESKDRSSGQHSQQEYLKVAGGGIASATTSQEELELRHIDSRGD